MNDCICGTFESSLFLRVGEHRLVKCVNCSLIRTSDRRWSEESYVGDHYFTVRNEYLGRWEEFRRIFESLIENIRRYRVHGQLLDVGAGVGIFLQVALQYGFEAKGIEISPWASAFAREEKGLDVITGRLEQANLPPESFDIVVANHVLEHVEHPREFLSETRSVLKENGLLVVGAPNAGSLMARIAGARWPSLRPEEHLWHFTPDTLRSLVSEEGFRVLSIEAKENHPATGWKPAALLRRAVNLVSVLANRSEAMLLFATKPPGTLVEAA